MSKFISVKVGSSTLKDNSEKLIPEQFAIINTDQIHFVLATPNGSRISFSNNDSIITLETLPAIRQKLLELQINPSTTRSFL